MATKRPRKKAAKKANGRPRIVFDLGQIEGLGSILATQDEMAAVLGCSVDTVQDRLKNDEGFSGALKRGQAGAKLQLRRLQMQAATRGNITMMIWLGKQWLGQRDQVQVDATVEERTGVAHVPPEVTMAHWEKEFGSVERDVDVPTGEAN